MKLRIAATIAFTGLACALLALAFLRGRDAGLGAPNDVELPLLGTAPEFRLVDQEGSAYGSADLAGRFWVADFVFSRCTSMCPLLTAAMAKLQSELEGDPLWSDLRLVSFSVDPGHDSPAVLADYAAKHEADPAHWKFLTGERDRIWTLSVDGFKLPVGDNPGGADTPLFHSDKFVLVDASGGIRGYYSGLDDGDREALVRDLRALHAQADAAPAVALAQPSNGGAKPTATITAPPEAD